MGVTSGGGIRSGDAAAGCMPSSATLQQSGMESSEVHWWHDTVLSRYRLLRKGSSL